MELKYLRTELHRLTALVEGWTGTDEIPALERDLALEKLRSLYEMLRFDPAPQPVGEEESRQMPLPVSIDLGEMLSLDELPDREPEAVVEAFADEELADSAPVEEPVAAEELVLAGNPAPATGNPAPAANPAPVEEPAPAEDVAPTVEPVPMEEPAKHEASAPAAEPVMTAEPVQAAEASLSMEASAPAVEPAQSAESVSEKEAVETGQSAPAEPAKAEEPIAEANPAPAAEASLSAEASASVAEPAAAPDAERESAPRTKEPQEAATAEAEHPTDNTRRQSPSPRVAPTLFGLEEETVRHRYRQRVIMSLYDYDTTPTAPTRERSDDAIRAAAATTPAPAAASSPESDDEVFSVLEVSAAGPVGETVAEHADAGHAVAEPAQPESPSAAEASTTWSAAAASAAQEPDAAELSGAAEPSEAAGEPLAGEPDANVDAGEIEPEEPAESSSAESSSAEPAAPEPAVTLSQAVTPSPAGSPAAGAAVPETPAEPLPRGAVLGEVINHDVQTLADTIAPPRDIASELRRSEPVTDLRKAIGINDKFLMIRDLFGGDGASYEVAIRALNAFDNLDDCMIYIAEHYAWNANSDGAKLLMELLERKFA